MEIRFMGVVERYELVEGKPAIQVKDDSGKFHISCIFSNDSMVFGDKNLSAVATPEQKQQVFPIGCKVEVRANLVSAVICNLFAEVVTIFDNNWVY